MTYVYMSYKFKNKFQMSSVVIELYDNVNSNWKTL